MTLSRVALGLAVLAVSGTAAFAGDAASEPPVKNKRPAPAITRDYSIDFKSKLDTSPVPGPPPGIAPLTREPITPFIGLSFTKPL